LRILEGSFRDRWVSWGLLKRRLVSTWLYDLGSAMCYVG
jgi:hypothetical protein